jgi:AcrR family transcriptional regulator
VTPRSEPDRDRRRICATLLELLAECDYGSLTLNQLLRRAGLSHAAFKRHFDDLEDCFATVWDEVDAELTATVTAAYRGEGDWQDRLRHAFLAGLRYLAHDPGRARLYVTEAFQVSEELRRRQYDSVARLGQIIDRGREATFHDEELPLGIAEVISGAIWQRIDSVVRAGQGARLPEQLHELMYFAILPYRGVEAAEAELRSA